MKISIIVPVYNLEEYIETCVESLINQTYENIEVLLINDGSLDKSEEICGVLEQCDNRIRLFSVPNGGVSKARNFGIAKSTGDYLMFVDGDDFVRENCIQDIVAIIESSMPDIIMGKMIEFYDDAHQAHETFSVDKEMFDNRRGIDFLAYLLEVVSVPVWASWRIIARAQLIKSNNIVFPDNISSAEDLDFCVSVYKYSRSVAMYDTPYYFYRKERNGSVMNSYSLKRYLDEILVINKLYREHVSDNGNFGRALSKWMAQILLNQIKNLVYLTDNEQEKLIIELSQNSHILKHSVGYKNRLLRVVIRILGLKNASKLYNMLKLRRQLK